MSSPSSAVQQQAEPAGNNCTCEYCDPEGYRRVDVWWNREIVIRNPETIRGPTIRALVNVNMTASESGDLIATDILNKVVDVYPEVARNESPMNGSERNNAVSAESGSLMAIDDLSGETINDGLPIFREIQILPTIGDTIESPLSFGSSMSLSGPSGLAGRPLVFESESSNYQFANNRNCNEVSSERLIIASIPTANEEPDLGSNTPGKKTLVSTGGAEKDGMPLHLMKGIDAFRIWKPKASKTLDEQDQLSGSAQISNQVEETQSFQAMENDENDGKEDEGLSRTRVTSTVQNENDGEIGNLNTNDVQLVNPEAEGDNKSPQTSTSLREPPSSSMGVSRKNKILTDLQKQERRKKDAARKRLARERARENANVKTFGRKKLVREMTKEEHAAIKTKWRVAAQFRRARQRDSMTPEEREETLRQQRERKRTKRAMIRRTHKLE